MKSHSGEWDVNLKWGLFASEVIMTTILKGLFSYVTYNIQTRTCSKARFFEAEPVEIQPLSVVGQTAAHSLPAFEMGLEPMRTDSQGLICPYFTGWLGIDERIKIWL